MPPDGSPHQPVKREPVQAAVLAVSGGSGEDEGEIARMAGGKKASFERDQQLVGRADADEARDADRVAVADDRHRIGAADDLALHHCRSISQSNTVSPTMPCDLLLT